MVRTNFHLVSRFTVNIGWFVFYSFVFIQYWVCLHMYVLVCIGNYWIDAWKCHGIWAFCTINALDLSLYGTQDLVIFKTVSGNQLHKNVLLYCSINIWADKDDVPDWLEYWYIWIILLFFCLCFILSWKTVQRNYENRRHTGTK